MINKNHELKVLLYNFTDEDKLTKLQALLTKMKLNPIVVAFDDYNQKVGYLFGLRGFKEHTSENQENDFVCDHELMMFYGFNKERLDNLLRAMRNDEIEVPACKAVVTSFNRFWSIRRVYETMKKGHLKEKLQKEEGNF